MATRDPGWSLRVLMAWLTLTFIFSWLPLVRSVMDGVSYEWGTRWFGVPFSGAGLTGDLWLLVAQAAFGLWLLYLGWRRPEPPFPPVLLLWLGLLTANSLFNALTSPDAYRFQGDTLGVDVSLASFAPLLHGLFFILALHWVGRRRWTEATSRPVWTRTNTGLIGLVLLLLPVQFVLLRAGSGQSADDVIGVLLTIGQWFVISAALYPWGGRASRPQFLPSAPERVG